MQDLHYNECKKRGTVDFPLDYHYIDSKHPQYEMPLHWHVEYEIILILEGHFQIFLDGEKYTLNKNDICFISDGILHGGTPNQCTYECVVFDIEMLRHRTYLSDQFLRKLVHHKVAIHPVLKNVPTSLLEATQLLFKSLRYKETGYELLTLSSLLLFLGLIEKCHYYSSDLISSLKEHKKIEQLKPALELIESSYDQRLSLEELSKSSGLSPKYFCKFFKEMTHKTPIDYLNYYRIERACYLISTSESSLIDIAYNCGFNDFSYFIKTFKKYKGTTPKKYT